MMHQLHSLLLALWVIGCPSDRFSASHDVSQEEAHPRILCSETRQEFGKVLQGDRLAHSFRLRNGGGAPLRIRAVEPSYSCHAVDPPSMIEPGASAALRIECNTEGRSGLLRDAVLVHSNDPKRAPLSLQLEAEIEPTLAFEPMLVDISTDVGKRVSKRVRLVGVRAGEAQLRVETIDPPGPHVEVVTGGAGLAGLRLTVDAQSVNALVGRVVVSTGLDSPKRLTLNYSARVAGNLAVQPSNPHFNLRDSRSRQQLIRVTSKRKDLRVTAAGTEGPFEARVETDSFGNQAIRVQVVDESLDVHQRAVLGKLDLFTNDPFEPAKQIPLFALGSSAK